MEGAVDVLMMVVIIPQRLPAAPSQMLSQPGKGILQMLQGTSSPSVGKATAGLVSETETFVGGWGGVWSSGHLDVPLLWPSISPVVAVGSANRPFHTLGLKCRRLLPLSQLPGPCPQ